MSSNLHSHSAIFSELTATITDFEWRTLNPQRQEIRILTLEPGRYGDQIVCSLHTVSLQDEPAFEALSYCWGDQAVVHNISVDGRLRPVTKNLEATLQRLRYEEDSRRIWADAVCINQEDDEEKGHQVSLMKDIYKSATETTLFIGDYVDDSTPYTLLDPGIQPDSQAGVEGAFALVRKLAENHHIFYHDLMENESTLIASGSVKIWYRSTDGILSLVSQPWWFRIWTVQEAILPDNSVVQYGAVRVNWGVFTAAAENLANHLFDRCCHAKVHHDSSTVSPPLVTFYSRVWALVRRREKPLPLALLLRRFRDRTATDPRDMIYGLLGLASDEAFAPKIQPDYTIGVVELYSQVVRKLIWYQGDLSPLARHPQAKGMPDLPSWVPDYSARGEWVHSSVLHISSSLDCWKPYDLKRVVLRPTNNSKVLEVSGVLFDKVIAVGDTMTPSPRGDILVTIQKWIGMLQSHEYWEMSYPAGEGTYKEIWWMLLCRGLLWLGDDSYRVATVRDKQRVEEEFPRIATERPKNTDLQLLYWQRFFITRKGYIGLGSPDVQVGDTVHVLVGGRTPFILRKVLLEERKFGSLLDQFFYVCDAYVLGIMNGGLLPTDHQSGELETFSLV